MNMPSLDLFQLATYFAHTNPDVAIKKRQGTVLALAVQASFSTLPDGGKRGIRVLEISSRPDPHLKATFSKVFRRLHKYSQQEVDPIEAYHQIIPSMLNENGQPLSFDEFSELVQTSEPEPMDETPPGVVGDGEASDAADTADMASAFGFEFTGIQSDLETADPDIADTGDAGADPQEQKQSAEIELAENYLTMLQSPWFELDQILRRIEAKTLPKYDVIIVPDMGLSNASNRDVLALLSELAECLALTGKLLWVAPLPISMEPEELRTWKTLRGHYDPSSYSLTSTQLGGDPEIQAEINASNLMLYAADETETPIVMGRATMNYDWQASMLQITYTDVTHVMIEGEDDTISMTMNQVQPFTVSHYIPSIQMIAALVQTLDIDVLTFTGRYVLPLEEKITKHTVLRFISNPQTQVQSESKSLRAQAHSYIMEFAHPQAPVLQLAPSLDPVTEEAGEEVFELEAEAIREEDAELNAVDDEDLVATGDPDEESE